MLPKHLKLPLTILLSLALLIALIPTAQAASILPKCVDEGYCTLCDILQTAINFGQFLLGIVGSLALLMFVYGGLTWLTSGGEPDKITAGKKILINSVVGLAITFFAYAIIIFVVSTLAPGWSWQDKMNLSCAPLAGLEPATPPTENQLGVEGSTCTTSTACNPDLFCDSTGKCRKKLALGAACHADATTMTIESTKDTQYQEQRTLSSYACIKGECNRKWIVDGSNSHFSSGICTSAPHSGDIGDFCQMSNQCKGMTRKDNTSGPALYCKCKVKRIGDTGCGGDGTATCQQKNVFGEECVGWTQSAVVLPDVDGDAYACLSLRCSNINGCLAE
jgi:hypothetical protein